MSAATIECADCLGTGYRPERGSCPYCHATGRLPGYNGHRSTFGDFTTMAPLIVRAEDGTGLMYVKHTPNSLSIAVLAVDPDWRIGEPAETIHCWSFALPVTDPDRAVERIVEWHETNGAETIAAWYRGAL